MLSDWQLLAVTGPNGCGNNGVIDATTEDYATLFAQGILTPPGEDLVDEWGLYNVREAVRNSAAGGCNEGFIRDDAILHIIFISDEDDNSPGWDEGDADYRKNFEKYLATQHGIQPSNQVGEEEEEGRGGGGKEEDEEALLQWALSLGGEQALQQHMHACMHAHCACTLRMHMHMHMHIHIHTHTHMHMQCYIL